MTTPLRYAELARRAGELGAFPLTLEWHRQPLEAKVDHGRALVDQYRDSDEPLAVSLRKEMPGLFRQLAPSRQLTTQAKKVAPTENGEAHSKHKATVIVKSFRRFDALLRLVKSIRLHYPQIPIIVADDSFENPSGPLTGDAKTVAETSGVKWLQMPFDSGLSAGRNLLVESANTPIVINCDDDFVFTKETRIDRLLHILQNDADVDLVAGLVRNDGFCASNWTGRMVFHGEPPRQRIQLLPNDSAWRKAGDAWYRRCDLAYNFFAARVASLKKFRWDERVKIVGEHIDHFLTMQTGGAHIAYTPNVIVGHGQERPDGYGEFRQRRQFYDHVLKKWGLESPIAHDPVEEPATQRSHLANTHICEMAGRPNLVLLGVGHSGTSIAAKMLHRLGWQAGDADEEYGESVSVRLANDALLRNWAPTHSQLESTLAALPQPWAIKDPRFAHTLDRWIEAMAQYEPFLLWLVRDVEAVKQSYQRRAEGIRFRMSVEELVEMAHAAYCAWPWGKMRLQYEQVQAAVAMFDVTRG